MRRAHVGVLDLLEAWRVGRQNRDRMVFTGRLSDALMVLPDAAGRPGFVLTAPSGSPWTGSLGPSGERSEFVVLVGERSTLQAVCHGRAEDLGTPMSLAHEMRDEFRRRGWGRRLGPPVRGEVLGEEAVRVVVELSDAAVLTEWKLVHDGWLYSVGALESASDDSAQVRDLVQQVLDSWEWLPQSGRVDQPAPFGTEAPGEPEQSEATSGPARGPVRGSDGVPQVTTDRLLLRGFTEADRDPFARMNQDPRVMEHFLAPMTRDASDAFVDRIVDHWRAEDWGLWALERGDTGEFIGFTGLWPVRFAAPFEPRVEIGWRLAAEHWGNGFATEAATAAVDHAFDVLGWPEIVSFTSVGNLPSRRVMERIGMRRDRDGDFEHPSLPLGHHLRPHVLYRLRAR